MPDALLCSWAGFAGFYGGRTGEGGFGFGFGFYLQHCSPLVDTLLPAKTWAPATALSAFIETVRFRSDRKDGTYELKTDIWWELT